MKKAVLLIVDMQNDFVRPSGTIAVPTAETVIPKVGQILDFFRKHKLPIIHIIREHHPDASDVEISRIAKFKEKNYAVPGTKGGEIVEELKPISGERILPKKRFSAFFMTELPLILERLKPEYVVISGIQTPNCIRHTAIDSLCFNYPTIVVSDATTAATPEIHKANLYDMEKMGIKILTIDKVENLLAS